MHSKRQLELLHGMLDNLEEGIEPINEHLLLDSDITHDEFQDLKDLVGAIIRGYVNLPNGMKAKVILSSAINNAETLNSVTAHYDHSRELKQFRKTLEELNENK